MNIDVVGRIRPSIRGEGPPQLITDNHNRMTSRTGGTYFTFQTLHKQESSNYDIFRTAVEPLLDLYIAGFNCALIVTGVSGSGKSYSVSGEGRSKSGIVPMLMEKIFERVVTDGRSYYDDHLRTNNVTIQMYEVYNELIKDLLVVPSIQSEYLDVDENAERGPYVRNLSTARLNSASDGVTVFHQGFARRSETMTDFGPAKNHASVVIHIELSLKTQESPLSNKSRFTIVLTPGIEKLQEDSSQIRLREGPTLSKSLVSVSQLVSSLANQPYADRVINYTESRLTYLLRDEIGGNCKTRVLMCFPPQCDNNAVAASLSLATQISQVKNFPIINDPLAQQLLVQYRARITNLQQQLGTGAGLGQPTQLHDIHDELRRVQTDNLQLRDKNERLHMRLEQLQNKFGSLATTKTDLSSQLLMTEEEKLKVSKTLVEMQIENNKLKEEAEAVKFDLTNKVLELENLLMSLEIDRDKHVKAAKNYKEHLSELENDRKDLADEYVILKSNYIAVTSAHEREVAKNEELSVELMNLVNAKAALLKRVDGRESMSEVDRVRAMISRTSKKPNDVHTTKEHRDQAEKSLFGNEKRHEGQLDRMKNQYDDTQKMLEGKLSAQTQQIAKLREMVRQKEKKVSELNAQMITLRGTNEQLIMQNNRIQHKLKDVNDEFKSRLVKYVEDIAQFVDKEMSKKDGARFRNYVDDMIKDLRKAHKIREEQLSQAAQTYKRSIDVVSRRHEELLVAYRELREQVEDRGLDEVDLGADEHTLQLTDKELHSKQQKEINRLREDLSQALTETESLKIRLRMEDHKGNPKKQSQDMENWFNLRKQLSEFTTNTQQELELERAELLSRNAMLDQQVQELHEYIDNHLMRYKDEIMRLREMLGMKDPAGFRSPPLRQ